MLARTVGSILLSSTVNSSCKLFSQKFSEININFARDNVAAARNYTIKTIVMGGMKQRYNNNLGWDFITAYKINITYLRIWILDGGATYVY